MATRKTHEAHPELYHYTNWAGLEGILSSGTLWATHYRHLNDTSEIEQFRPHFVEWLQPHIEELMGRYYNNSPRLRNLRKELGSIKRVAYRDAKGLVDSFYRVTYGGRDYDKPAFVTPFITSFCSHVDQNTYVRENGLLSQWRGYGPGGGFAIVFNTEALSDLLRADAKRYHMSLGHFSDVVYDDDTSTMEVEFQDLLQVIPDLYPSLIGISNQEYHKLPESRHVYEIFTKATTRTKHKGFQEEKEVRIVVGIVKQEEYDQRSKLSPDIVIPDKEHKSIKYRGKNNNIPYIDLFFDRNTKYLPIKCIIVGPHSDQKRQMEKARDLVSPYSIPVVLSQTPYVERAAN